MTYLEKLDDQQREAATSPLGTVKVMAGAGTGKTTTLTARVQHLIEAFQVRPQNIVLVTFTNKAAKEIKERLATALGAEVAREIRVGTFHALSARIIRRNAAHFGLDGRFLIIEETEARNILETAIEMAGVVPAFEEPDIKGLSAGEAKKELKAAKQSYKASIASMADMCEEKISRWKESGLTIETVQEEREARSRPDELAAAVYVAYQAELERRNVCDFSDLILHVVRKLERDQSFREKLSSQVHHLLVDEFQDTNLAQAKWVDLLSSFHGNRFVVGDVDQSIYAFRTACPAIMSNLTGAGVKEITLFNNRRSNQNILDAANLVVDYVDGRPGPKVLQSVHGYKDAPIRLQDHKNEFAEAFSIAGDISALLKQGVPAHEVAVLMRVSRLSRPIEEALIKRRIPYALIKGTSVLEVAEIKDILAYLKFAANPNLEGAFERLLNRPVRGLGEACLQAINAIARAHDCALVEAVARFGAGEGQVRVKQEARQNAAALAIFLERLQTLAQEGESPAELIQMAWIDSGYRDHLINGDKDRSNRAGELVAMLIRLSEESEDIYEFLNEISLFTDADAGRPEQRVQVMTMHASKGLEFDHVFCPALEEGILPHAFALEEQEKYQPVTASYSDPWVGPPLGGLDEERRLCHVAFTRARNGLHLSYAAMRNGKESGPSRFIGDCELVPDRQRRYAGQNPDMNDPAPFPNLGSLRM